jgi:hypothetical protein
MKLLWTVGIASWLAGTALAQTDVNVPGPAQRGAVGGLMVPGVPMPVGPPWYTDPHSGSIAGGTGPGVSPAPGGDSSGARLVPAPYPPPRGVIFMPRPPSSVTPGTSVGPSYGGTSGGPGTTSPPSPALQSPRDLMPK